MIKKMTTEEAFNLAIEALLGTAGYIEDVVCTDDDDYEQKVEEIEKYEQAAGMIKDWYTVVEKALELACYEVYCLKGYYPHGHNVWRDRYIEMAKKYISDKKGDEE